MTDLANLLQLENSVWKAVVDSDPQSLAQLLSEDYVEITVCGKRVTRDEIVNQSWQVDAIDSYGIADAKIVELYGNGAILSYALKLDGTLRGEPISPVRRWVTSIWRFANGKYECCFFQQTGVPSR